MKRLNNVRTEMALHVLAYNLKRVMKIIGIISLMEAIKHNMLFLPVWTQSRGSLY